MAKLRKGILGAISGAIGPVVGSTWKKINYVKTRPKKKSKKIPRTPAQLANERKFKFVQQWLVPFHPFVTVGFSNFASDKTEINAAFADNYNRAFSGTWPDIVVDHSKVMISRGRLEGLLHVTLVRSSATSLELTWERSAERHVSFDDQLMLLVYCPELKLADGFIGGVKRNALGCSFDFDAQMAAQAIEVYLTLTSSSRKTISDSMYLGRIEP